MREVVLFEHGLYELRMVTGWYYLYIYDKVIAPISNPLLMGTPETSSDV